MTSLWFLLLTAVASPTAASATLPLQQAQGPDSTYGCLSCHAEMRSAFSRGVHAERGIQCHNCHGGDPTAETLPAGHRAPYSGVLSKTAVVNLCGSCHSNPNLMRPYGLQSGEVADFRTSRHGILLLQQRNTDAPTCTDCHDAHTILRPDDARSTVHPLNISQTCGRCHEDQDLMGRYRLPTDQVALYNRSAHGIALTERQNLASPTCLGCHGAHSALPPATAEVSTVCGRCHVQAGRAFESGPHGAAARGDQLDGCLACHGNHDTEGLPPDRIAATCSRCHAAETEAARVGGVIEADVLQAAADLRSALEAIAEVAATGEATGELEFRYQNARTSYLQLTEVQHNLDLEQMEQLTRRVRSITRDIRTSADAIAEHKWEHGLWLVPVWFLALAWVALSVLTLRRLERRASDP